MEEIDLMNVIKYFLKRWYLIIGVAVICVCFGILYTKYFITPLYKTSTTLILTDTKFETEADEIAYPKLIDRFTVVANSNVVINKVIENLKLGITIDDFKKNLDVEYFPSNYALRINITNEDAELAKKIADETAKVLIEKVDEIYQNKQIKVLDEAFVSFSPINVDMLGNVVKFVLGGIIIVCGFIFLKYIIEDKKMKNKSEIK